MNKTTKCKLIILFILIYNWGNAQNYQVRLQVKDNLQQAIEGAVCKFTNDSSEIVAYSSTDSIGIAKIEVPEGEYTLDIILLGRSLYSTSIHVSQPMDMSEICITPLVYNLEEVAVVAQRRVLKEKNGKLIFDTRSIPIQQNANAIDALACTPMLSLSSSGISIMGESGEIRINGVKINKGVSLYDYLCSIQLIQIEHIEVHAGRTSDMDAALAGGYVNIILKKLSGWQGYARGNIGYNGKSYEEKSRNLFTEGLNTGATYGKGNFSLFASASLGNKEPKGAEIKNKYIIKTQDYERSSHGYNQYNRNQSLDISYGAAYSIKQNKFNIEGTFYDNLNSFSTDRETLQTIDKAASMARNIWKKNTPEYQSYSFSAGYDFTSKNKKNNLSWVASFINNSDDFQVNYTVADFSNPQQKEIIQTNSTSSMFYTQLVFSRKMDNIFQWNAGAKYSMTHRKNINYYSIEEQASNIDKYNYQEIIPSAFAEGTLSLNNFYLAAGLRMEHTALISHNDNVKQQYTDLFPSLTASYKLKDGKSIRFNYSRSIFRPSFTLLNNYSIKTSEYEYSVGNPLLRAQITDAIGISFIANKHTLRASWSYSANPITNTIYSKHDTIFMTNINGGIHNSFNLAHSFSGNIFSFWHLSSNVGLQYLLLPQSEYERKIVQGYASLRNTITIVEPLKIQIDGGYSSPWIMTDRKVKDRFNVDVALRYSLQKQNLTFTLTGKNLIARRRTASITDNRYVYYNSWRESAPLIIEVGISWSFSAGENIKTQRVNDNNLDKYRL